MVEAAGVHVDLRLPTEQLWANCDPLRLTQIIVNLLGNAAKFTDRRGLVTLSLRRDKGANNAVLSVIDDGMGIDPDVLPQLFEPFNHVEPAHGGTVEARSEGRGRGAEFIVRLPLLDRPPE